MDANHSSSDGAPFCFLQWALTFSNYLGRYFVNECKFNRNQFDSEEQLSRYLVSNWPARPTGKLQRIRSAYSEITYFPSHQPYWIKKAQLSGAQEVALE